MNSLRIVILSSSFTGFVIMLGYYFGGQVGALLALIISAGINFSAYFWSGKIVLRTYGAREVGLSENANLRKIMSELALALNLPTPRLFIMGSKMPNAFTTGRNKNHAIVVVTRGLIDILDEEELRGVLAHELAHIKNRDILVGSVAAVFAGLLAYFVQLTYFVNIFRSASTDNKGGQGLLGRMMMIILAPMISIILHIAVSRSREYITDESAARIIGSADGLAKALVKISDFSKKHEYYASPKQEVAAHLFIINPFVPSVLMALFSSHPSVEKRVYKLKRL